MSWLIRRSMSIEFTCLNCRHRMVADDSDVGAKVDCPDCGLTVKVPAPIGGRLTDKRIVSPDVPPLLQPDYPVGTEGSAAHVQPPRLRKKASASKRQVAVPKEPANGYNLDYDFDGIFGRDEEDAASDAMEEILDGIEDHFEEFPEYFESAGLLLVLYTFTDEEITMRLGGSLNRERISIEERWSLIVHRGGARRNLAQVLINATDPIEITGITPRVLAGRCIRPLTAEFLKQLDQLAGRRKSGWFW